MSVELERIPPPQERPSPPRYKRWMFLGVGILLIGAVATFLLWRGSRSGITFWGLAAGLPVVVWALLLSGRCYSYALICQRCDKKNATIAARYRSEVIRGQRFCWFIGEMLINALEESYQPTHLAVLAREPLMIPVKPLNGGKPMRHRPLAATGSIADRQMRYFTEIISRAQQLVDKLPSEITCYLACDTGELFAALPAALQNNITRPLIRIRHLTGLDLLDYWLDCHYDQPSALLIVSAQLFAQPPEDSGEAISLLLLNNCRLPGIPELSVKIHRPQICHDNDLLRALKLAMMWAGLEKTKLMRAWISGSERVSEDIFSKARETYTPALKTENIAHIDMVAGFAGIAAPWQALQLAIRQCLAENAAQLMMTELSADNRQLCIVTPEHSSKDGLSS